jgi:hypothetical protein
MAAALGAEAAEQPKPNPLQELADDLLGTWVSEWTAKKDHPEEIWKKGDKSRTEISYAWALDQTILEFEMSMAIPVDKKPEVVGKGIIAWHPATKRITLYWFGKGSGVGQATWSKEGDDIWVHKPKLVGREGRESSSTITVEVVDKNTRVYKFRERTATKAAGCPTHA